ncbi:HAD family hydrolase [Desulfosoma sp.]
MTPGPAALKAVIFDFDGVIVDSEPLHYQAFCDVLEPLGLAHSYDVYVERYIGFDDRDAIRAIFQDTGRPLDADTFERLLRAKEEAFQKIVARGVVPFAGAKELVEELLRAGLPLAIASGAKGDEIRLILQGLGMLHAFSAIVSADDVAAGKPHPETYQRALQALFSRHPALRSNPATDGSSPQGVVVIEDTPTGIQAARSAGLFVVGVGHTYPVSELYQAHWAVPRIADLSVERLRDALLRHEP